MKKIRAQAVFRLFGSLITLLSLLISPLQPRSAALAQASPHIDVWVDTNTVSGYQWPEGATITFTLVNGGTELYLATQTFAGSVNFQVPTDIPIQSGQQVSLTDGVTTQTTTVANLPAPTIDLPNNQISGTTNANATVWIYLCNQDGCANRWISADSSGHYLFDFLLSGPDPRIHLYPDDSSSVNVADVSGNNTSRSWRIPNPRIEASVNKHWVNARDWPNGQTLTLLINNVSFGTAVVGPQSWALNDIFANFNPPSLQVGDVLKVQNEDLSIVKTLTLSPIKLTNINLASNSLTGQAAPNTRVDVGVDVQNGCAGRRVQADAQGNWMADFSTVSNAQGDCGTATFGPGVKGWANNFEADGDITMMNWEMPHVEVFLNRHSVSAYNWVVGDSLTLTVTNPPAQPYTRTVTNGTATEETVQGYTQFFLPDDVLFNPGEQVTVSNGALAQTTTIQNLLAPDIDFAGSRLTGTAAQGAAISTCLNSVWPCIPRSVIAGMGGGYVLDFSQPGPNAGEDRTRVFQANDGGVLKWKDSMGNFTARDWKLPSYTLHVNRLDQEVHGHDWPVGTLVTLTLDDPHTSAHKTAQQTVLDLPNQCGAPCFLMADVGWTLAVGQSVQMSAGPVTKTVVISPLASTRIDALHDVLVGKATPNSYISIGEGSMTSLGRVIQTDANGDWFVDFSVPRDVNGPAETVNLVKGSGGRMLQINPPGWGQDDGTLQYWHAGDPMVLSATQVQENVPGGSVVGTFTPAFPEVSQTLVYSLAAGEGSTDSAAFTIDRNALKINAAPNYEVQAAYSIRVRVEDTQASGKWYETTYTISVVDVNEPATQVNLSPSAIGENNPAGSPVGSLSTNDPDSGATYTYSLVSGAGSTDNAAFTIDGSTLRLKAAPDFETQSTYNVRVRAVESGQPAHTLEQVLSVSITNWVEAPIVTSFQKTGLQDSPVPFTVTDFTDHFVNLEAPGTSTLQKVKITALPSHGTLRVGGGASLTPGSEILAANLVQLVYQPQTSYVGNDVFAWTAADNAGYAAGQAEVALSIGAVTRYGLTISPTGDAKSAEAGTSAVYTLVLQNSGNQTDSYTVALQNTPAWTTTTMPAQVTGLAAGAQSQISVQVAVPASAVGSDTAVLRIASQGDPTRVVTMQVVTSAVSTLPAPEPVLLGVSPASAASTALTATTLTLSGANFTQPMTVMVSGLASPTVTRSDSVTLLAAVPTALQPGIYPVQVCDASARCASLADAFRVLDNTPRLFSVYPRQGFYDTSNPVTITGDNLSPATTLTMIGVSAPQPLTNAQAVEGGVRATVPAGLAAGTYRLQACNGEVCTILNDAYAVLSPAQNDFAASPGDLWVAPATVREGNTIQLGLNVHHISGVGNSRVQVAFYRDDPTIPANQIGPQYMLWTPYLPVGSAIALSAPWTPVGVTGAVRIFAVIDPNGLLTEATRADNIVSTTIYILPREIRDEIAPIINSMMINGGSNWTSQPQVNLNVYAMDNPGGSGMNSMSITEFVFNSAAGQWVAVQQTGWIPYQTSYPMSLTGQPGIHYLQARVADRAGNTSAMYQTQINYQLPTYTVAQGQTQIFRIPLSANQPQHIVLQSLSGDADLYVRDPDGNLVAYSYNGGPLLDRVDFTTRVSGVYQVEVFGFYWSSAFTINFQAPPPGATPLTARFLMTTEKTPRWQPAIQVQNEPLTYNSGAPAPITAWRDETFLYLPVVVR